MSALAHPLPLSPVQLVPARRRRHLWLVPPAADRPSRERAAEVIALPVAHEPRPARPAVAARSTLAAAPLRLTTRGRRVVVALVFAVAAAVGAIGGSLASSADGAVAEVDSVTVASGQTLWSIAAGLTPAGGDVRDVVSQIVALNDLDGHELLAGQQLTVPAVD